MEQLKFIDTIANMCAELSLNVLPSVTIAQAALESGWGESGLTKNANALFGIKAGNNWKGKTYNAVTKEVINNTTITTSANFRAYDSWGQSIIDHDNFLSNLTRYEKVIAATDGKTAARELQAAGYATDPDYAAKLIDIMDRYDLYMYDETTADTKPANVKEIEILANPGDTLNITVRVLSNG